MKPASLSEAKSSSGFAQQQQHKHEVSLHVCKFKINSKRLVVLDGHVATVDYSFGEGTDSGWLAVKRGERCLLHVRGEELVNQLQLEKWVRQTSSSSHGVLESYGTSCSPWMDIAQENLSSLIFFSVPTAGTSSSKRTTPINERNRRGNRLLEALVIHNTKHGVTSKEIRELQIQSSLRNDEAQQDASNPSTTSSGKIGGGRQFYDKGMRHELFAEWLIYTFGKVTLVSGMGVLDVGGGNGALGHALAKRGIPSVLLDPDPRYKSSYSEDEEESQQPQHYVPKHVIPKPLMGDGSVLLADETYGSWIRSCSVVVGMHPDQATEALIDLALGLNKPFAVLPCCVLVKLFPHRRQKNHPQQQVRSHRAFYQYLMDKTDPSTGAVFIGDALPFDGRNQIIYCMMIMNDPTATAFCMEIANPLK